MNKALDEVRAGESRRVASEGRTPLLKKSRYNRKTVRAYFLTEAFQQLWDYTSHDWAGKFLDEWCRQTIRSRIGLRS